MITAIIKNPRVGGDDRGHVSLMFDTYVSESSAASQWIRVDDPKFKQILARVDDVKDLEGKPCWVDDSKGSLLIFEKLWDTF